ncbi:uncharacterized protein LOC100177863 [Ciona intestinalis]
MEKFRSIFNNPESGSSRRASHAGFDSRRVVEPELQRRGSLPATFVKKVDTSRRIHTSSACVNLIKEFQEIKIVNKKKGKNVRIDPLLQDVVRRQQQNDDMDMTSEDEEEVKRSSSVENFKETKVIQLRSVTSDTEIENLGISDPMEGE